jgi:hypothetical protein
MDLHEVHPQARQAWETYVAQHDRLPSQNAFERLVGVGRDKARVEYKYVLHQHEPCPTTSEGRAVFP